ncbi:hypothetical protein FGK63_16865 [Ruegeria sediminis]|uniref:Uncharacterized protein n=1 Tax=Ruegeria sediminis TaxID=2583820 RepID=A0ABY2WVB3_9RHOB|nr:hypothetical protein [Ruegeria sediminis]TMV05709.1 hypothetical protein FGK63_16865 [Ruegeria sediminis]
MATEKIATCCYCGTRAALVLRGETRRELSCATCGAPLHNLKMLKVEHLRPKKPEKERRDRPLPRPAKPALKNPRKQKKRKTIGRKILSEAIDFIEDIFD